MVNCLATLKYDRIQASTGAFSMKSEFKANQAIADYNEKEYTMRQQWQKVLAAPVKPRQVKPVVKQGLFSRLFKVV